MSAATLFEAGKFVGGHRRGGFVSLLTGGFGAAQEVPQVRALPRSTPGELSMRDYLRGLDRLIQQADQAQIGQTLVEVTPKEIQVLVEKTAKAKARYLAETLDLAEGETLPEAKHMDALAQSRARMEEMQAGLETLLNELRHGRIKVAGVAWRPDDVADQDSAEERGDARS
jgi:hypothetical protein